MKNFISISFYQSIPDVDDEINDVTSVPGTPSDNKPITASNARGDALYTNEPQINTVGLPPVSCPYYERK